MPGNDGMTVFIVHPDVAVRDALTLALGYRGFSLQQYPSPSEFLAKCPAGAPGCVVACLQQIRADGVFSESLQQMLGRHPVVLIAEQASAADVRASFLAGASDVLPDGVATPELALSVKRALQHARGRRLGDPGSLPGKVADPLTRREVEIAQWVRQGHDNRTIAERLGISHRTVEVHKTRLMRKLGARTLPELIARMARSSGRKIPKK